MAYRVLTHMSAPGQVYRVGDVFSKEQYGSGLVNAWLRDHWVEEIEEEGEAEEGAIPEAVGCIVCGKSYKTIKGFVRHVKAKHPEEL